MNRLATVTTFLPHSLLCYLFFFLHLFLPLSLYLSRHFLFLSSLCRCLGSLVIRRTMVHTRIKPKIDRSKLNFTFFIRKNFNFLSLVFFQDFEPFFLLAWSLAHLDLGVQQRALATLVDHVLRRMCRSCPDLGLWCATEVRPAPPRFPLSQIQGLKSNTLLWQFWMIKPRHCQKLIQGTESNPVFIWLRASAGWYSMYS